MASACAPHDFRQSDFGSVKKLFDANFCSMKYSLADDRAPWGISRFQGVNLHGVGVFLDEGYGRRSVARTRSHILADSLADFIVVIPLMRQSRMAQGGAIRNCGPGNFRILSTAVPFSGHVEIADARDRYAELLAKIPGAMLRNLVPRIDEISNIPLALRPGAGNVMKAFFDLALTEGAALSDAQGREFSAALVGAVAAAVSESGEYQVLSAVPRASSRQRVQEKAKDFILRSLANPDLDCSMVAHHCEVSLRYLHSAFPAGETVADFIREARLQKCRTALRDAQLAGQTVATIASNWGFTCAASFSRLYRARFKVTPGEDRT